MQSYKNIHTNQTDLFSGYGDLSQYVICPPPALTTQEQPRNNPLDMFHVFVYCSRIVKRESHVHEYLNQGLCCQGIQDKKLF